MNKQIPRGHWSLIAHRPEVQAAQERLYPERKPKLPRVVLHGQPLSCEIKLSKATLGGTITGGCSGASVGLFKRLAPPHVDHEGDLHRPR